MSRTQRKGQSSPVATTSATESTAIKPTDGGTTNSMWVEVVGNVVEERKAVLKMAVALQAHSEKYAALMGAVNVCEGYVWNWLKASFPDGKEGKLEYQKLVESTGLGTCMVERYIRLSNKLIKSRRLDPKTMVLLDAAIQEQGEVSVEVVEKVADKLGRGKTMTDLMREQGMLPKLEPASKGNSTTLVEKQVTDRLKRIKSDSTELEKLVKGLDAAKTNPALRGSVIKYEKGWIDDAVIARKALDTAIGMIQLAVLVPMTDREIAQATIDPPKEAPAGRTLESVPA